jgi:hypothetical protein
MQTGVGSRLQSSPVMTHQLIATTSTAGFHHMQTQPASGLPSNISQGCAHSIIISYLVCKPCLSFVSNMLTVNAIRGAHPIHGPNQLTWS